MNFPEIRKRHATCKSLDTTLGVNFHAAFADIPG
jgi:hypothetical protein